VYYILYIIIVYNLYIYIYIYIFKQYNDSEITLEETSSLISCLILFETCWSGDNVRFLFCMLIVSLLVSGRISDPVKAEQDSSLQKFF
jgi:hypothetical protein